MPSNEIQKFEFWFTVRNRRTGYRTETMVKKKSFQDAIEWFNAYMEDDPELTNEELIQITKDHVK